MTHTPSAEALRDDLDNAATALIGRAVDLHNLARDYSANQSTRDAKRHNGTEWVPMGEALTVEMDTVLRESDALVVASRALLEFPRSYATALGSAARAARAALDALRAYPVAGAR